MGICCLLRSIFRRRLWGVVWGGAGVSRRMGRGRGGRRIWGLVVGGMRRGRGFRRRLPVARRGRGGRFVGRRSLGCGVGLFVGGNIVVES